ncbi:MAG: NAD(P)H-hydrate dehydratase [Burkholderiaceae bacterium]
MRTTSHGFCTIQSIRALERAALARLPAGTLMARAAQAVADEADRMLRRLPAGMPVLALVGPGANGADALLAVLELGRRGYRASAHALSDAIPADPDSRHVHQRWRDAHGQPAPIAGFEYEDAGPALVIDGLFGIGLARPLDGVAAEALRRIADLGWPLLAVDVPSGIDPDTGAIVGGASGVAASAVATVTMIADKPGLHTGEGIARSGRVRVADLGLAPPAPAGIAIDHGWVRGHLSPRGANTHKGSFGTAMIVGGSPGMEGAALLAARGAQAAGAGKTIVASPEGRPFDPAQPQLMSRCLGLSPSGVEGAFAGMTALAIGCGLGRSDAAAAWLAAALDSAIPLVLDADALNLCADDPALAANLAARSLEAVSILTPHPLEAARLLGTSVAEVQSARIDAACRLARDFRSVVLLKGAGTILADPTGRWGIVRAGSPALASAGTGDVLAGVVAGMLCQNPDAFAAAGTAAWVHGTAGERWAASHPMQRGLSAAALVEFLTESIDEIA